jgi:HEAT repeat protein
MGRQEGSAQLEKRFSPLHVGSLPDEVRKMLGELHHLDEVTQELSALGDKGVGPLSEFLNSPPEVVPHARVAAVRALSLIGTASALQALKAALFAHELKGIDPVQAQSEYVVKNAAIEELLRKGWSTQADFLEAFRRYRLPAAINAILKYRVFDAIPLLIDALEDDVIATRVAEALRQLGEASIPALLEALSIRHLSGEIESRVSRQRRILVASTLGEIGSKAVEPNLMRIREDIDPTLAGVAIAALMKLGFSPISLKEAEILLKGALSHEWAARERCRNAAAHLGEIGTDAALELLSLESLPDLYGIPRSVSDSEKAWLVAYIVENAATFHSINILLETSPKTLLIRGLWLVESGKGLPNLLLLAKHDNWEVRRVVAHVLGRIREERALQALFHFLGSWDRGTVKEARESLRRFPRAALERAAREKLRFIEPGWKRLLIEWRLGPILRNSK